MSTDISEELQDFVIRETYIPNLKVTADLQLEDDLGITGDDADDFLIKYSKLFNVDLSNFPAGKYFSNEGAGILTAFIDIFRPTKIVEKAGRPFTVGDLQKGIIAGKLDDEMLK